MLFNKEKTLQVFGRNRVEDALTSLFAALSNRLLFSVIFLQYEVCSSAGSFNKGTFKFIACFLDVNCSFATHTHRRMHVPTLAVFWQHSTICFLYKASYFVLITIVQRT